MESFHAGCGPVEVSLKHSISNKGGIIFGLVLEYFKYCTFLTKDSMHTVNCLCQDS